MLLRITLVLLFSFTLSWSQITKVASVGFTVRNLDNEVRFFEEVLQFKKIAEFNLNPEVSMELFGLPAQGIRVAVLQLGEETLQLMQFEDTVGREIPHNSRSNDLWFQHVAIVVSDMDSAYERIREHQLQFVSSSPQTLPDYLPNAAGIRAFYFQDPEGHVLELIQFPEGKGNPKWSARKEQLFLGLDHSAIGIDKTTISLPFYSKVLGLEVGGTSENYGIEQEHLNQVFGAHLIITGLHAASGMGIEFLDYLSPPGGLVYPEDSKPSDLWHWNYLLETENLEGIHSRLLEMRVPLISRGIVRIEQPDAGYSIKALLTRDPDGHALLIYQSINQKS